MVDSLIDGSMTRWAQPVISATRARRGPSAGKVWGLSMGLGGGSEAGARSIIALSRLGSRGRKGLAIGRARLAPNKASRNRPVRGKRKANRLRSARSGKARWWVSSM